MNFEKLQFENNLSIPITSDFLPPDVNSPELLKIIELISLQNPLQKKRIRNFLRSQTGEYWSYAESLSKILNHTFLTNDDERQQAALAYNKMCMDFLREQIRFRKTGVYRINDSSVAVEEVYNDLNVMRYYMVGLLISYLFWPNHYELFKFFKKQLSQMNAPKSYLEVGVGHGLFTSTIMERFPSVAATIVDISATSIRTAKEILKTFQIDAGLIDIIHGDYLTVDFGARAFDFIIMGEVLEHVNNAPDFMARTKKILKKGGSIYLSTCANSPALDHVYHFKSADEIRDLIRSAGFKIVSDIALPAENVPPELWEKELTTINYCAHLEHNEL
jgi:2-polyprenyl-3-methyl-5-hydroxy-6-metoxy-1,4-benzoquinol methylase